MKYENPLTEIVPPKIRLEVYKKALELIEDWKYGQEKEKQVFLKYPELCLLLPALLYGQIHWLEREHCYFHSQTKIAFPELNKGFLSEIFFLSVQEEMTKIRVKYLKSWIAELEQLQKETENNQIDSQKE